MKTHNGLFWREWRSRPVLRPFVWFKRLVCWNCLLVWRVFVPLKGDWD